MWYTATFNLIDIKSGDNRVVYKPKDQLGWPSATSSGDYLAVVEVVCSDRWLVAGNLLIIDRNNGEVEYIDTKGMDVTYMEWRSNERILFVGQRSFASVIGEYEMPCPLR